MPPQEYQFSLSEEVYGTAYFFTERGVVTEFVVKLLFKGKGQIFEVIRYDTAHGGPHRDTLLPDGTKYQMKKYHYLDNNQALTFALDDMYEHWEFYVERFKQWLEKKENIL